MMSGWMNFIMRTKKELIKSVTDKTQITLMFAC